MYDLSFRSASRIEHRHRSILEMNNARSPWSNECVRIPDIVVQKTKTIQSIKKHLVYATLIFLSILLPISTVHSPPPLRSFSSSPPRTTLGARVVRARVYLSLLHT